MEIVAGAMHTLLPKLNTLLSGEYELQRGLHGKIKFLKDELESMHAALTNVPEAETTDDLDMIWAGSVRDLSYDVEDTIDKFMVDIKDNPCAHVPGIRGFFGRCFGLLTKAKKRHQIATNIEQIKRLVTEVAERRDRYRIDTIQQPTAQRIDPRLCGMFEESEKLVAINGPEQELSSLLMEQEGTSERQLKVISIVGLGGLGKTTLANVTYQQHRHQFDCDAFVSVSLKPDLMKILSSILHQVSDQGCAQSETWDAEELINKIRRVLINKRYFIIIDDIWDESAWKYIKCALIENNCGSRIITTTRLATVAISCCSDIDGTVYNLKPLLHDDSKRLFYKRIFGSEDGCQPELKEISEKILEKCSGVPLAIITIASLLATKEPNMSEWNRVHKSIGSGLEKCSKMDNMRQILSISYDGLPSVLKPCLLYLTVFPEDYTIPINQLVRRWIAEGFVHGQHDALHDDLYSLGISYIYELVNRSLIQPDAYGSIQTCRVHDMVLDLITSLSSKENLVRTFDGHQHADLPENVRRLSLQNNDEEQILTRATFSLTHVRSLIVFPGATNLMPPLSDIPVLRVLDLEHCRDLENRHIAGLGKLYHLRYLVLSDTAITELPAELGNLHCLHTLDLSNTSITELPSTTVHLKQLVRLYIEDSVKLPKGIGELNLLQVLSSIGVSSSPNIVGELGNLTELRVLHISLISGNGTWSKSYEKPLLDSMIKLQKIQELHIQPSGVTTEFIEEFEWFPQHLNSFLGGAFRLPNWMNSSLSNLQEINMWLSIIRHEDLQNLGDMPFLCRLFLSAGKVKSTKQRLVIGTDRSHFPCLYELRFDTGAMGIMFAQGAMPKLATVAIALGSRNTIDIYGDFNLGLENLYSVRQISVKILCNGSRRGEVDSAEADIRRALSQNRNNPTYNVTRCFEDQIILEEEEEVDEEIIEQEEIMPERVGPWGGEGRSNHDIKVAPMHLKSIKVSCGQVVDAIGFSYLDKKGKQHTTPLWGDYGGTVYTVNFAPSEFLKEVSGTFGPFFSFPNVVTSVELITNERSYGPFGNTKGTAFRARAKENGNIVGFFGSSTVYLDSIGVYIHA
uniref:Jacalin-type lectin domain-containing protein n=1 Tax=Leersia perrieri TaxID=77586 RepID=A0A0D9XSA0_9ORYZ